MLIADGICGMRSTEKVLGNHCFDIKIAASLRVRRIHEDQNPVGQTNQ